jgi:Fur family zinc uptake transcriptional regulator
MARAEATCRANGARLTPIRRKVLETLQATRGALGAYDLADALADEHGRRLAPITIYRALDFLIAQGLAHRLASRNAFVACPHGHAPEELVAFLICENCGEVEEQAAPGLAGALSQVLAGARFDPYFRVLEVSGCCARCRPEPAEGRAAA